MPILPWFRAYAEFATDPKVQMMSEALQRRLIMMFCARCNGHVTLQDEEVTFLLRITPEEWAETKAVFVAKGFIDESNSVLNWDKRQYRSDSSAERVARHRNKRKQADVTPRNVTVTPPDTEQIQNRTEQKERVVRRGSRFALTQPPPEWISFCMQERSDLNPKATFEAFRDYWISIPGAKGCKLDWLATWRNWVRTQKRDGLTKLDKAADIKAHNERVIEEGRKKYADAG